MDITGFGTDLLRNRSQKGNHIMPDYGLYLINPPYVEARPLLYALERRLGDFSQLGPGLTNSDFNIKPFPEPVFRFPESSHLLFGITLYHYSPRRKFNA